MPNIDLHALANTPGAGLAMKALEDAGLVMPVAPEGKTAFKVTAEVEVTRSYSVEMVVFASSKEAALDYMREVTPDLADTAFPDHEDITVDCISAKPVTLADWAAMPARKRREIEEAE